MEWISVSFDNQYTPSAFTLVSVMRLHLNILYRFKDNTLFKVNHGDIFTVNTLYSEQYHPPLRSLRIPRLHTLYYYAIDR